MCRWVSGRVPHCLLASALTMARSRSQFSSWIGWFPVLFFGTTWVAEIYIKENAGAGTDLSSAALEIREEGTRVGTRAMLFHAIISLATSLLLPPLVVESGSSDVKAPYTNSATWFDTVRARLPTLPFDWLTLPRLWTFSNAMFGSLLFLGTYLSRDSVGWASAVLAAAGFCWAVTNWAPFAIVSVSLGIRLLSACLSTLLCSSAISFYESVDRKGR